MDTTRLPGRASDSWWREPQQRLADLRDEINRVNRGIGANGFVFSTQSLVIKGDGQIVGEGTGTLDWNGPAHFGGDTTIDGTLNIGAGLIGDSALASQISSDVLRDTATQYHVPTSWSDIVTTTIDTPDWATEVTLVMIGQIQWVIDPNAGTPYGRIRIRAQGENSFEQISIGGSFEWVTATVSWSQKIIAPPPSFTVGLQAKADAGMFTPDPDTNAVLSVQALFLR